MKVFEIFAVGYNMVSVYPLASVQKGIYYYVYDKLDKSIELWRGEDLRGRASDTSKPSIDLENLKFDREINIIRDNELIITNNGVYKYIWYGGEAYVYNLDSLMRVTNVNPITVTVIWNVHQLDNYSIDYKNMLRRIALEGV